MKVIDLYVLISKKEYDKLPDKIKYKGCIYNLEIDEDFINYNPQDNGNWLLNQFLYKLNDEVEIIEPQEHKIPEKIEICYSPDIEEEIFYEKGNKPNHYVLGDVGTKLIINKINEIIDYLEEIK